MSMFVVSSMPDDVLVVLGTRTSAGTVMTIFGLRVHKQDQHLKGQAPGSGMNRNYWMLKTSD